MNGDRYDASIVGSGILGLAHAYHLARAGMRVAVFERHGRPVGASIRNFGMIWPVGQPAGEIRQAALESRGHWLDVLRSAGIWHRECGSLHLAYAGDELSVLEEFVALGSAYGYRALMITPEEALQRSPVIKGAGLLGAMWNPEELCVFPREVMATLPAFLSTRLGVRFHFNSPVVSVEDRCLVTSSGSHRADRIVVCPGGDLRTLFPDILEPEGIRLCKLQMLRVKPKCTDFRIGPHLCAGLTLGHYANFQICEKLSALTERFARELPSTSNGGSIFWSASTRTAALPLETHTSIRKRWTRS